MSAEEVVIENDEDEFEIEIEDDTPEEDRGRAKASDDEPENDDIDDEELKNYSAGAAKRIKTLTRKRHEERRRGDEKERQLNEALSLVSKLRNQLGGAAKAVITRDKEALTNELETAKKELAAAVDTGDGEKMAELTEKVSDIRSKLNGALRAEKEIGTQQEQTVNDDQGNLVDQSNWPKSRKEWLKRNSDWFHKDEEMTGYVYGLHQKLVKNGVVPDSEEYYSAIDKRMRTHFKEFFEADGDEVEEDRPAPRRATPKTVSFDGASNRSEGKKRKQKVYKLTKSQADLCARLGISHQDYIKEQLKMDEQ